MPIIGDPGEARTLDPLIKSQLLYQLSYGVNALSSAILNCDAKVATISDMAKFFANIFSKYFLVAR